MATLTYFTAKLHYRVLTGDEKVDIDYDPQNKGIHSGVTITPFVKNGHGFDASTLQVPTLTPEAAMVVLAPIRARLDNGVLMLRVDPDRPVDNYANLAAFPGTGNTARLYRAQDTQIIYAWTGSAYEVTDSYTPVRLVAQTDVLGLPEGAILAYRFDFHHVTFNGADQELARFAIAAPEADAVLNVATAARIPL